ncbi:MAG: TonB-dependent receptor [Candidatus Elarobacter sp.]
MASATMSRRSILLAVALAFAVVQPALAAEATTGTIIGSVVSATGAPVPNAQLDVASPSGRYTTTTDLRGRFAILGVVPDSYVISVEASGFETLSQGGVTVLPGQSQRIEFRLVSELKTIGSVRVSAAKAFGVGNTGDVFAVSGETARGLTPPVSSSGLANYTAGTVQGAIASVPGVVLDPFANAILRGGQIDDAVFEYDSVPIPQGLIAEPGGNVSGAQLPTTGIGSTTVTLAGYETQGDNALGGVIDQIPAVGSYPGSATVEFAEGIAGARTQLTSFQLLGASPDQRWRYAVASTVGSDSFSYGDGSFYPAEAATYGVALQSRGQYSVESNVHYRLSAKDDLSVLGLVGQGVYDQYGTPYAGQTFGAFDGAHTTYPGATNPNAPVTFAAGIRGTFDILKATWLHTGAHSLSRVQLYQSQFGASAGGPYWDENGFPNGTFSFLGHQGARQDGLGYDGENLLGERHHLKFGAEYRINDYSLDQIVPTFDEVVRSHPRLNSYLAYLGDTWSASRRLDLMGAGRLSGTHIVPSSGVAYDVGALDPHFAAVYRLGDRYALRATFDHSTVAPKPLEADRSDSTNVDAAGNPAPFVTLRPETANDFTASLEGGGRTLFRATYYAEFEKNRIDVLPVNFRQVVAGESQPSPVGIPTNVGELRARGLELWLKRGGFTLDSNYGRAFSSSAAQFANNDLNAPAIAAGHLFPVSYVPDFNATLSYEIAAGRRVRISPSLSYESGYPYGNGRLAWVFDPATNKPEQVPNDNFVNPGANFFFLRDPALPFNASTNPYIGNLGTAEGDDPNTLRSPPQTLVNLHLEGDLTPRLTVIVDVVNLLGNFSPSAYQTNPYLIGPPGYAGGNPTYAAYYQGVINSSQPYAQGNGIPTNDGVTQAVPWSYGRAGYVPQSYPLGRTIQVRLRYRL